MKQPPISVTIITLNEAKNLPRAIASVSWANEVLVVDCGSTDGTVEIARQLGAKVIQNPWPGYGQQKNFAQNHAAHDWILNIDADEEVSPELAQQISENVANAEKSNVYGFYFPRKTFYLGRWIRHGGWYPNYLVRLAHKKHASWTEPAVHEELKVDGDLMMLPEPLLHYTFSSIQEQIQTNLRYARLGSERLKEKGQEPSCWKLLFKPTGKFLETYLVKRGFMDGLPGFIISVNAAHSMFLKYAYLHESDLTEAARGSS